MKSGSKMFTVDKFLGINESADGLTELAMGEASVMENFFITDAYNLSVRPGIQRLDFKQERSIAPILASWSGHIGDEENEDVDDEYLVIVDFSGGKDRIWMYRAGDDGQFSVFYTQTGALGLTASENSYVKIFPFGSRLYIMSAANTVYFEDGKFQTAEAYVPLVIAGMSPSGGGTTIENINLLTGKRRCDFSADGTATAYTLPSEAISVEKVVIDNVEKTPSTVGSFNASTHVFTFTTAPVKGVGNVEFTYNTDAAAAEENRMHIVKMMLTEAYNGSTDTRLFIAGDGSNICYYSGVTQGGDADPMYFPSMNEIAVDMTSAAVTGLVRHYSKLMVYTRGGGAYVISYEPVTQTDGSTVAGFFLRAANREFGNDVMGQVRTVNNFPRTITEDGIYSWNITASYYKDERYAKLISDKVRKSLKAANLSKVIACDDNFSKTYYVFLNDAQGTVLVNRYDLGKEGVWCIYRAEMFRNVRNAMVSHGVMVFVNDTEPFYLDSSLIYDAPASLDGEETQIKALWESGYMAFGADFQRKYSSQLYVSVLPQSHSGMVVTASTDRRDEYMEKDVGVNVFTWADADFRWWSFDTNSAPKIRRVRLKIKKFVYYKLIFRVDAPGARATVLGYDQIIRYGSMAK